MTEHSGNRVLERYNAYKLGWLRDSKFLIAAMALVFIVFRFLIGLSVVGGDSMEPTLADGTIVVYSRIAGNIAQGDIVALRVASGEYYIKRVAAAGRSTVDIHGGAIYVDGQEWNDEHSVGATEEETNAVIYPYYVREGSFFVLGDNREVSMDSRMFGEISRRQIRGRIILSIGRSGIHGE